MRSSLSIDVAAPVDVVFALARDVTRWSSLLPHYVRSRPIGAMTNARATDGRATRVVEFVARRPVLPLLGLGVPVAWRSRCWSEPDRTGREHRLRFVHLGGATAGMDVTWRLVPTATGCRVTIEHVFAPSVPGWAFAVDRVVTRAVATRTLRTFAALAETLVPVVRPAVPPEMERRDPADASSSEPESAAAVPANPLA